MFFLFFSSITRMTYLEECEPLVEHQSKKETWDDQEQVPEGVVVLVIRLFDSPVALHVPNDHPTCAYVNNLEYRVVAANRERERERERERVEITQQSKF